ncbi:MAG: hypothetical protein ACRC7O_19085 [Fimbriiglobus sp.]
MIQAERKFTGSQTVLLAAYDLAVAGNVEFSEWDLTVSAWARDRFRFGLRGYAQSYPDHKRVMMEIMGQKPHSPVQQKYLEKIRPNFYRLTPLGKATAARLLKGDTAKSDTAKGTDKPVTVKELYEIAANFLARQEFRRWQDYPEEPREWAGAMAFLGRGSAFEDEPADQLTHILEAFKAAIDWCNVQGAVYLTRGSGQGGTPIHIRELAEMLDFLQALKYRFPEELDPETKAAKPKNRIKN